MTPYQSTSARQGPAQFLESMCTGWCPSSCRDSPHRRCHKNLWRDKDACLSLRYEGHRTLLLSLMSAVMRYEFPATSKEMFMVQSLHHPTETDILLWGASFTILYQWLPSLYPQGCVGGHRVSANVKMSLHMICKGM